MAKEILDKVLAAEQECNDIIREAKEKALAIEENAQAEAKQYIADVQHREQLSADEMLAETNRKCAQLTADAQSNAQASSKALSEIADSKREAVIKSTVEKFF